MCNFQPRTILIRDATARDRVSNLLHDAVFRARDVQFQARDRVFQMILWREVTECTRRSRLFPFVWRVHVLRARCRLVFHNVAGATIDIRDRLDYFSLFRIECDKRRSCLRCHTEGAINIEVAIGTLDGTLVDTGETSWDQFGYSMLRPGPAGVSSFRVT